MSWIEVTYDEIEEYRKANNLSKLNMARFIGVTNSTYHNWKRSKAVATPQAQKRIALLLLKPPPAPPTTLTGIQRQLQTKLKRSHAAFIHKHAPRFMENIITLDLPPEEMAELAVSCASELFKKLANFRGAAL